MIYWRLGGYSSNFNNVLFKADIMKKFFLADFESDLEIDGAKLVAAIDEIDGIDWNNLR